MHQTLDPRLHRRWSLLGLLHVSRSSLSTSSPTTRACLHTPSALPLGSIGLLAPQDATDGSQAAAIVAGRSRGEQGWASGM